MARFREFDGLLGFHSRPAESEKGFLHQRAVLGPEFRVVRVIESRTEDQFQ